MVLKLIFIYFLGGFVALAQAQQSEATSTTSGTAVAQLKATKENKATGVVTFTVGKKVNTLTVRIAPETISTQPHSNMATETGMSATPAIWAMCKPMRRVMWQP